MLEFMGTQITMFEGTSFNDGDVVVGSHDIFYVAHSKFGRSFANNPEQALQGAKRQISDALGVTQD